MIIIENDKLIRACCANDIEAVKWLLDNIDTNAIDFKKGINRSALHEAVLHSNGRPLVRLLCQCGADPKQRDSLGEFLFYYELSESFVQFQVVLPFIMLLVMVIWIL